MVRIETTLTLTVCLLGGFLVHTDARGLAWTSYPTSSSASTGGDVKAYGHGSSANVYGSSDAHSDATAKAGSDYTAGHSGWGSTYADTQNNGYYHTTNGVASSTAASSGQGSTGHTFDYSSSSGSGSQAYGASSAHGIHNTYTQDHASTGYSDNSAGATSTGAAIGNGYTSTSGYSNSDWKQASSSTNGYSSGDTASIIQYSNQDTGAASGNAVATGATYNGHIGGHTSGQSQYSSASNYAQAGGAGDVVIAGTHTSSTYSSPYSGK